MYIYTSLARVENTLAGAMDAVRVHPAVSDIRDPGTTYIYIDIDKDIYVYTYIYIYKYIHIYI